MKTMGRQALAACAGLLVSAAGYAVSYYVDVNYTGPGSGTSADPYNTLTAALAASNASHVGWSSVSNTIYVADGTYRSSNVPGGLESFGAAGLAIAGASTSGTRIWGGYAGYNAGAGTFDWSTRAPRSSVIDLTGANARAFYSNGTMDRSYDEVDGLTFSNANNTLAGGAVNLGGGGYAAGARITNCLFQNNVTTNDGGAAVVSGVYEAGMPYVRNSDFVNNKAANGGAVKLSYYFQYSDAEVTDCRFQGNEATTGSGGALFVNGDYGNWSATSSLVSRSVFTDNRAAVNGGAITLYSGASHDIKQCIFDGNYAGGQGGAVGSAGGYWSGAFSVENSLIYNNTAGGAGGYALWAAGVRGEAVYGLDVAYATLAYNSGGIYSASGNGESGTPQRNLRVRDSILAFNTGTGIYATLVPGTYALLEYNDVFGNGTAYGGSAVAGTGSISVDPLFIDPVNGNFLLPLFGTLARGSASNIGIYLDLVGTARPQWYYDMGALQSIPEPASGLLLLLATTPLLRRRRHARG